MQYVTDVQYDESLLLWHIATDLCYYTPGHKKPTMMSVVGGIGKIRFRDTCAEAERFFDRRKGTLSKRENKKKRENIVEAKACKVILSVITDVKPMTVKGDRSKSVLFDASMLAQELNRLEADKGLDKWKLLCRVWVELISYAASHY